MDTWSWKLNCLLAQAVKCDESAAPSNEISFIMYGVKPFRIVSFLMVRVSHNVRIVCVVWTFGNKTLSF